MTILSPARVVDEDAVDTKVDADGNVIGFTVEAMVLSGPFASKVAIAKMICPVGVVIPALPPPGSEVLLCFTDDRIDGDIYVIGQIPGGGLAVPKAAAGIDISGGGLAGVQVNQPPKGVGIRNYVRGAAFVVKVKGNEEDYAGEVYFECDDADDSTDGNGTFFRMVRVPSSTDPTKFVFAVKIRDAKGASVEVFDGTATIRSPNGENFLWVDDVGVHIRASLVEINGDTIRQDGVILLNYPPGVPPTAASGGVVVGQLGGEIVGVAHVSQTVFCGPVLCHTYLHQ